MFMILCARSGYALASRGRAERHGASSFTTSCSVSPSELWVLVSVCCRDTFFRIPEIVRLVVEPCLSGPVLLPVLLAWPSSSREWSDAKDTVLTCRVRIREGSRDNCLPARTAPRDALAGELA